MLTRNPTITQPMRQSPDVQGVRINFGPAPAHGRWRAMVLTIGFISRAGERRVVKWARSEERHGSNDLSRRADERVEYILLDKWELKT